MQTVCKEDHSEDVPVNLIGIHAGRTGRSAAFERRYQLLAFFNLKCVGCCWDYLVSERQYQPPPKKYYDFNYVKFSHNPAHVSMYVDGPRLRNHRNGVIKTGHDDDLGKRGPRPVMQGHSYQIYVPRNQQEPKKLAFGQQATVRIEAIAVPELKGSYELDGCYFNYCDAALLELYREDKEKRSLEGICCSMRPRTSHDDDLAGELNDLHI